MIPTIVNHRHILYSHSFFIASHHVFTILFDGKLYTAPITEYPENIIDVGTGTGK